MHDIICHWISWKLLPNKDFLFLYSFIFSSPFFFFFQISFSFFCGSEHSVYWSSSKFLRLVASPTEAVGTSLVDLDEAVWSVHVSVVCEGSRKRKGSYFSVEKAVRAKLRAHTQAKGSGGTDCWPTGFCTITHKNKPKCFFFFQRYQISICSLSHSVSFFIFLGFIMYASRNIWVAMWMYFLASWKRRQRWNFGFISIEWCVLEYYDHRRTMRLTLRWEHLFYQLYNF